MFIGTDEVYYHNVYFKNLDDGKKSRMFRERKLYFFPEKDIIEPNSDFIAFSIGKGTKSIRVNGNGLFIEINDLNGNIETYYYDNAALLEISKEGYSAGSIDYIEENIKRKGINPDRIIKTNKKEDKLIISVSENNEVIDQEEFLTDGSRTLYSIYYEYMKEKSYYDDIMMQTNKKM